MPTDRQISHTSEQSSSKGDVAHREPTTHAQLALELFADFAPRGQMISASPTEIGFNRANLFLDVQDLSLAGRRAIDVAYFIVAQAELDDRYFSRQESNTYTVDLEFFKWLMGYTSNNRAHLQSVLRQGQKAAVEVLKDSIPQIALQQAANNEEKAPVREVSRKSKTTVKAEPSNSIKDMGDWISVPLMGPVGIIKGAVHFEVHAKLEPYIKSPLSSHFLDLRFVFSKLRGRILYDRLQPYIEAGLTPWIDVDDLRVALDCTTKLYREFKYFKSRALDLAIEDINTNTNLTIEMQELLEKGSSRKIAHVRFKIQKNSEHTSPQEHLTMLTHLYGVLVDEFGLNRDQLYEISRNRTEWSDQRIQQAIDYTRHKLKQGKVKVTPAGYLMKALREHYVLGTAMIEMERQKQGAAARVSHPLTNTSSTPGAPTVDLDARRANSEEGWVLFEKAPKDQQQDAIATFLRSPVARIAASADKLKVADIGVEQLRSANMLRLGFGIHALESLRGKREKG